MTDTDPDYFPTAKLVVTGGEYVDRNLATASWWDRYELDPGEYPVEYTGIDWKPLRPGQRPYYAVIRGIRATLTDSYRVNRLFTASSAEQTRPDRQTTISLNTYAYRVRDEPVMVSGPWQYPLPSEIIAQIIVTD